ncbi:MAG: hypothetical protein RL208_622 [Pseudomonadota bacterium]
MISFSTFFEKIIDFLLKKVQDKLFLSFITIVSSIISIVTSYCYELSLFVGPFNAFIIIAMYIIIGILIIKILWYRYKICVKESQNITITKEESLKTENDIINNPNDVDKILASFALGRITFNNATNLIQLIQPNPQPIIDRMNKICNNKKEQYSHDEIDNFDKLFNEFLHSYKSTEVKSLLLKAQQNIDQISKDTVLFLITLDDKKLEILKQQFKYVIFGYEGIILYNDQKQVEKDFFDKRLNHQRCGDILEFTNSIWFFGKERGTDININANNYHIVKISQYKSISIHNTQQSEVQFTLYYFRQLTQTGFEVYNLLKDQIDENPDKYLENIVIYHQKKHPNLQISFSSNTQSTQAKPQE